MHSTSVIFHADMDAFYTSVEQRDNPALRGKPVIVGAAPGSRGVVSAASYEARKFGVRSAMPISTAYAKCPHGIYLRPRMAAYACESEKVMDILRSFSPLVEPISIDEAFVDMSGTEKLWGPPRATAESIAARIRGELGLSVSIGIAPNKFLAKLASDLNKPAGITAAPFDSDAISAWLAPMPVSRIWGVGAKTQHYLQTMSIVTIGDLQKLSQKRLHGLFGEHGRHMFDLCRGVDERDVAPSGEAKSISREHTFAADCANPQQWHETLLSLARDVAAQARAQGVKGATVVFIYRTPDFRRYTRRCTLNTPTDIAHRIHAEALRLLDKERHKLRALRLIGVGITNLCTEAQMDLFAAGSAEQAWEASETAMDVIAQRYGERAIFLGGEIASQKKKLPRRKPVS